MQVAQPAMGLCPAIKAPAEALPLLFALGVMSEGATGSAGSHRRRQTVISDEADESLPDAAAQQPRALVLDEDDSDQPALQAAAGKPGQQRWALYYALVSAAGHHKAGDSGCAAGCCCLRGCSAADRAQQHQPVHLQSATAVSVTKPPPQQGGAAEMGMAICNLQPFRSWQLHVGNCPWDCRHAVLKAAEHWHQSLALSVPAAVHRHAAAAGVAAPGHRHEATVAHMHNNAALLDAEHCRHLRRAASRCNTGAT